MACCGKDMHVSTASVIPASGALVCSGAASMHGQQPALVYSFWTEDAALPCPALPCPGWYIPMGCTCISMSPGVFKMHWSADPTCIHYKAACTSTILLLVWRWNATDAWTYTWHRDPKHSSRCCHQIHTTVYIVLVHSVWTRTLSCLYTHLLQNLHMDGMMYNAQMYGSIFMKLFWKHYTNGWKSMLLIDIQCCSILATVHVHVCVWHEYGAE